MRKRHRRVAQARVRRIVCGVGAVKPPLEAQDLKLARADRVHDGIKPRAVHERRAGALVARVLRKIAYERHLRAREQWQQGAPCVSWLALVCRGGLVLEEYDALGRYTPRELMVRVHVELSASGRLDGRCRRECELDRLVDARVHIGLG